MTKKSKKVTVLLLLFSIFILFYYLFFHEKKEIFINNYINETETLRNYKLSSDSNSLYILNINKNIKSNSALSRITPSQIYKKQKNKIIALDFFAEKSIKDAAIINGELYFVADEINDYTLYRQNLQTEELKKILDLNIDSFREVAETQDIDIYILSDSLLVGDLLLLSIDNYQEELNKFLQAYKQLEDGIINEDELEEIIAPYLVFEKKVVDQNYCYEDDFFKNERNEGQIKIELFYCQTGEEIENWLLDQDKLDRAFPDENHQYSLWEIRMINYLPQKWILAIERYSSELQKTEQILLTEENINQLAVNGSNSSFDQVPQTKDILIDEVDYKSRIYSLVVRQGRILLLEE